MVVKKEALLSTAAQTFATHPGASLAEVAAAAGVSRTTIFSRYPTRASLLEAVALDGISRLESAYASVSSSAPAVDVLTELVASLIPLGPHIAFLFRERSLDENRAVQLRLMSLQELDHALLRRAQAEKTLRRDAPVAWLSRSLDALVFAAWEGVDAGELAALDAPHHVMAMFLGGAQPRPSRQ
jgi:AcrR family transcriptional regulator